MKKEVSTNKRRSLKAIDRQRLANMIPDNAHRGLRMLCADEALDLQIDCPVNSAAGQFACLKLNDIRLDLGSIKDFADQILGKMVNSEETGYFDQVGKPLSVLDQRIGGISDVAKRDISILDIAELIRGPSSGVGNVRTILNIYRSLKSIAQTLESDDGMLLAEYCQFIPGQDVLCTGGVT